MRVVTLAYACEPNRGSESEVGWRWVIAAATAGHEVTVVTRANNRAKIESAVDELDGLAIRFVYHEAPAFFLWAKRRLKLPRLYYAAWQAALIPRLWRWVRNRDFDRYHHLTYVSARFPSVFALARGGFVWGPIGGLGVVPQQLRSTMPLRERLVECVRDLAMRLDRVNPLWWWTAVSCERVIVADSDTYERLPRVIRAKAELIPAIGSASVPRPERMVHNEGVEVVLVGQLVARKGQELALRALDKVRGLPWRCSVIGDGPNRAHLERVSGELGLGDRIAFLGPLPRSELMDCLKMRPVFLALSYRESGGMAVLEAASMGCPIVFLDIGGPKLLLADLGVGAVPPGEPKSVVDEAARWLGTFISDPAAAEAAGSVAWEAAMRHSWDDKVRAVEWLYGIQGDRP